MTKSMGLTDVLKKIHKDINGEKLQAGEIVEALEHRGYGPLLLAVSLLSVLPTGGIPGVPTITALLIILIAAQIVFGLKSPWLPKFLSEREIKKKKFESARKKAEPFTKQIDKILKPRLEQLTTGIGARIVAALCILLAILMPPLEIIPLAAMLPALTIAVMALGLSAKDGYVMIVGLILTAVSISTAIYYLW